MKIAKKLAVAALLLAIGIIGMPSIVNAQKECIRQYKVTITQESSIPSGCTGTVQVTVNGTVYSTPYVQGQSEYFFPEVNSYPQTVCPGITTLSCGMSAQSVVCSSLQTRMPCGTYDLYSIFVGPPLTD